MKFNKLEKEWLKKNGFWKKVKKRTKKCPRYVKKYPYSLAHAFEWDETKEGYSYWEDMNMTMLINLSGVAK